MVTTLPYLEKLDLSHFVQEHTRSWTQVTTKNTCLVTLYLTHTFIIVTDHSESVLQGRCSLNQMKPNVRQ